MLEHCGGMPAPPKVGVRAHIDTGVSPIVEQWQGELAQHDRDVGDEADPQLANLVSSIAFAPFVDLGYRVGRQLSIVDGCARGLHGMPPIRHGAAGHLFDDELVHCSVLTARVATRKWVWTPANVCRSQQVMCVSPTSEE